MANYTGVAGCKHYTLGEQLGAEGEGIVYEISGDSNHVAKIYRPGRLSSEAVQNTMECKLKAMLSMNVPAMVDGLIRLAWPQDILYENGKIVGFVMPRINAKYKIYDVYRKGRYSLREREYTNFTWKYSVQFAYNMAWVVNYLHSYNIVIGDLSNIAVDVKTGAVILIDCDSFDIRDTKTGEHFPCVVGYAGILAPELQTVDFLRNGKFTRESDNFSLAIHIFQLLMDGAHPFYDEHIRPTRETELFYPWTTQIIKGKCPYVRLSSDIEEPRWAPRMDTLPPEIVAAFDRTFNYTEETAAERAKNRTTAEEWCKVLLKYALPEPNPNLARCGVNSNHIFSVHNKSCPWCEREDRMKSWTSAMVGDNSKRKTKLGIFRKRNRKRGESVDG